MDKWPADPPSDPHLRGLVDRADGPFRGDTLLRAQLAALFPSLSPAGRPLLATLLHRTIDRRVSPAPLLSVLAATPAPASTAELLLATLETADGRPNLSPLLLRGVRRLLELDPAAVPPWLLLVRLFQENERSVRDLAATLPLLTDELPGRRPGDTAVKILHVAAALRAAGVGTPLFCRALVELARGPARLPALVSRLFGLFTPPALEDAERIPARRIGTGEVAARPGDLLFALPVSLRDGIESPGALRLRDAAGNLLSAGYVFPAREGTFLLEAESPEGRTARRSVTVRFDETLPPPEEPLLSDRRFHPSAHDRFDALNFLAGFIAGFEEPAGGAPPPPDRAALLRASRAYLDSARGGAIAATLAGEPPAERSRALSDAAPPAAGASLLVY